MHFSMFPLFLLLASTLCGSPVYIERRLNVFGTELPNGFRNNGVYKLSETIKAHNTPFVGISGALKMERDIPFMQITYIYVEVLETRLGPMMATICNLELTHELTRWGWDLIETHSRVAFVLEAKREAEESVVTQYWRYNDVDLASLHSQLSRCLGD